MRFLGDWPLLLIRRHVRRDDRIAYRIKRPLPDGTMHLLFTALDLLATPVGNNGRAVYSLA